MPKRKNVPAKKGSKSSSNEVTTAEENVGSSSGKEVKLPEVVINPSNDPNLDSEESNEIAKQVEDAEGQKKIEDGVLDLSLNDDKGGKAVINKSGKKGGKAANSKASKKNGAAGVDKSGKKGGKTVVAKSDEESTTPNVIPRPTSTKQTLKIVKMKQLKLADPNVDPYDYDADEALIRQTYKLPFNDMMQYEDHADKLLDGEKRYIAEEIKANYQFMENETVRLRRQMRAVKARFGRLRKQIEREETADSLGIDRNTVPRSSKGIGKKFGAEK
uniref:INO80 complex subunit 2 n=1 Tax=Panagrellus redivivus TaxID=6233 RepID=A0A7E4UPP8_PANRE